MGKVNLFLLLPETRPSNQWMNSNEQWQNEESFSLFVHNLKKYFLIIKLEKYDGFYDLLNINNFLEHYKILDDYYPKAPLHILRVLLNDLDNWRESFCQSNTEKYQIFNQTIENHSFCEIAERQRRYTENRFVLFNYHAVTIRNTISITFAHATSTIHTVTDLSIKYWFSNNRIPQRVFHLSPKHGENGVGHYLNASSLMCHRERACQLLLTAIGEFKNEIFNYDDQVNMIIVFKSENDPSNQYHGYHVPITSQEVPDTIRELLLN